MVDMGNYFMMSIRFNKQSPEEFGLTLNDNSDTFVRLNDNSQWKKRPLYDYGWGEENGYYKVPMPSFDELVSIILQSKNEDDKYGAAAVILDDFCDELMEKCFEIFEDGKDVKKYFEFFRILKLQNPINRSSIIGKHYSEVSKDFEKWKTIAKMVST